MTALVPFQFLRGGEDRTSLPPVRGQTIPKEGLLMRNPLAILAIAAQARAGRILAILAAALLAATLGATPAQGQSVVNLIALINGPQEVPPTTTSNAFGVAHMTFDASTSMLCYTIAYSALTTTETAAHFHGPALPGVDAGVLLDISPSPSPLSSPKNGCVGPLSATQQADLLARKLYINIHSTQFPGGEIRGQVLPIN